MLSGVLWFISGYVFTVLLVFLTQFADADPVMPTRVWHVLQVPNRDEPASPRAAPVAQEYHWDVSPFFLRQRRQAEED